MNRKASLLLIVLAVFATASCSEGESPKSAISGRSGELIVVATKAQWESESGSAIREALGSDYGYLPQEEPKFDLMLVPKEGVNRLIRTHRNMLYLNIADTAEARISIRRDVWAAPQTMVMVSAPSAEKATSLILDNKESIAKVFDDAERNRNMTAARAFEVKDLTAKISSIYGGSPCIPDGYALKKQVPGFIWVSSETTFTMLGIFIYSFPYEGEGQFSAAELVEKRNEVLQHNVPATGEGSYMITNPAIVPEFSKVTYNGIERFQLRGLWDTCNDFMGGPFISHAFLDKSGENVIVVEGFVYAPKYDKRNYLRQVDAIISTFRWVDPSEFVESN